MKPFLKVHCLQGTFINLTFCNLVLSRIQKGSVSWASGLIRTPVLAFLGFPCVAYFLSFCRCFTFESQIYAFARCAVDRNQIHKIWIVPQFSWCKCQFSWCKWRSVVSFDNCTCLAPSANSSMSQTSANRHHLSPGYPVSWPLSPPHPQNKYPCPCDSLSCTCFQFFFVSCFAHIIPHLHCRNLGLPHVIGVSRAVIYLSLLGPTIMKYKETFPAKLGIWIQSIHYGMFDAVLKLWCTSQRQSALYKYLKKYGSFFRLNFHQKSRTFEM